MSIATNQTLRRLSLSVALAATVSLTTPALGQLAYDISVVADTNTPIPGGTGNFTWFPYSGISLSGENVAFDGRGSSGQQGIYTNIGGITLVADQNTPIPDGPGNFSSFYSPSLDGQNVAFGGYGSSSHGGIYTDIGGLSVVADVNTLIPGTSVAFTSFAQASIDGGYFAFKGSSSVNGQSGIYKDIDGLSLVADRDTLIPESTEYFTVFPSLRESSFSEGNVAFLGLGSDQAGIYIDSGGLDVVADRNTPIPGGTGNFGSFSDPAIDGVNVVFKGTNIGFEQIGIYVDIDGLDVVADRNTPIPGGSGNFYNFLQEPAINNGNVAFTGISATGERGIYLRTASGNLDMVIDQNTPIPGGTGNFTSIYDARLDGGNIAFVGTGSDGQTGVYLIRLGHRWQSLASGDWDTASNWSLDMLPQDLLPTSITPTNGLVITGPQLPVTLHSLQIGAQTSGTAELRLQPGGQITVRESVEVQAGGKLLIDGVLSVGSSPDSTNAGVIELTSGSQFNGGGQLINTGVVRGSGQISMTLINRGSGETRVGAQEQLTFTETANSNQGRIEVLGGEVEFTQGLLNEEAVSTPVAESPGFIEGRDATFRFGASGLTNRGSVGISFGTSDLFGDVLNEGTMTLSGNSSTTLWDDVNNAGSMTVGTGSTAVFFGDLSGNGVGGGGTVLLEGDLLPGFSAGTMEFGGSVSFGPRAGLEIEIGGLAENDYDRVLVSGDVMADGALAVSLIDSFSLEPDQSFEIIDVGGLLSGGFEGLAEGELIGNFGGTSLHITYMGGDGNNVALITSPPGDYSGDGVVNLADYVVWRNNLGGPAGTLLNDTVGGVIGVPHYNLWRSNFAQTAAAVEGVESNATVPEPTSLMQLFFAVAAICYRLAISQCASASLGYRSRRP